MIKQFKNIITSPLFILCILGSIFVLVMTYFKFNYPDKSISNAYRYSIEYHENIEEYDEEIAFYNKLIESMPEKERNYEAMKKYYEDAIKIYELLKKDNINYEKLVYEGSPICEYDSIAFLDYSSAVLVMIMLINIIVIVYLTFTREFDNSRYMFIYGENRDNVIRNKIIVSFIIFITALFLYYLIFYIFSFKFDSNYQYVLVVEDDVRFVSRSSYIFRCMFLYAIYDSLFYFALIWSIALLVRKSLFFAIGVVALIVILTLLSNFTNVMVYLGLYFDFEVLSYNLYLVSMISIVLPIGLLTYGIMHLRKCDL